MGYIRAINDYIGVILLLIAWGVWKIAPILTAILRHVEMLA
jgi:hypothetical protein